ncbi:MAG: NAD(P)H-hydrate epimerase [Pirellulaceae bacterium]|nr:NAD(P)H-hydrate epimerase [Planctomycetales bacterium]
MAGTSPKPAILTREQVRELDVQAVSKLKVPSIVLMENAGRGTADVMQKLGIEGMVAICCGKGNNAGDGLVVARHLTLRGYHCEVLCWESPEGLRDDAGINRDICRACGIGLHQLSGDEGALQATNYFHVADWIVDALLGTGAQGAPRPPLDAVIRAANASRARRMALDIPSGLDADTGVASSPTFQADHTCTYAAIKPGLLVPAAQVLVGQLHVIDIGIDVHWA